MIVRGRGTHLCAAVLMAGLAAAGCASAGAGTPGAGQTPKTTAPASSKPARPPHSTTSQAAPGTHRASRPLAGKVIGIDPGHNGLNHTDPAYIDRQIWNGREWENCNTTGTQTAS